MEDGEGQKGCGWGIRDGGWGREKRKNRNIPCSGDADWSFEFLLADLVFAIVSEDFFSYFLSKHVFFPPPNPAYLVPPLTPKKRVNNKNLQFQNHHAFSRQPNFSERLFRLLHVILLLRTILHIEVVHEFLPLRPIDHVHVLATIKRWCEVRERLWRSEFWKGLLRGEIRDWVP